VRIRVEGSAGEIARFTRELVKEAPPLARIDSLGGTSVSPEGYGAFAVIRSDTEAQGRLPVSPDVAVCQACTDEMEDPSNRRYRYPFITCTDCGPRFTVIESMPYDRERSTMRAFRQCPDCLREYRDPESRRYHSETNSCPACGPKVWLEAEGRGRVDGERALAVAAKLLLQGRVLAVRGLGGFHLAALASDEMGVRRLRARKEREAKPLAIMVADVHEARRLALVGDAEAGLLESRERPIVLLERLNHAPLARAVAPRLAHVGVMLAYTPLHRLLLQAVGRPLVMTSGNRSDEPIATGNEEARGRLSDIADALLLHDREIVARYDDSLVRTAGDDVVFLRRARGYAPLPVPLPVPVSRCVLAVGPHLKNTFTVAHEGDAWVSQHVGDLENFETLQHFQDALERFKTLFRLEPEAVVRDLHPTYLSTRVAEETGLEELPPVQHHHAHVAAVMGEHRRTAPTLGLAFDGTGFGDDGRVWGCEFLEADLTGFVRRGMLRYSPLPGGDVAARAPWRSALGYASLAEDGADDLKLAFEGVDATERAVAEQQIHRRVNAPMASSLGRLFDAAAAVLGVRRLAAYEGQAPMELEALAGGIAADPLPLPFSLDEQGVWVLDPLPLLTALGSLRARGDSVTRLAARFHEGVAQGTAELAKRICRERNLDTVALSGGCFQNARLLGGVRRRLEDVGLRVLVPHALGPNDGAVSYGQAVVAAARMAGS
jgi:hydrogenase maturation protein HypF